MPNWCENSVYFEGNKEDIEKIGEIKMDFEKIIPMPKIIIKESKLHEALFDTKDSTEKKRLEQELVEIHKKVPLSAWHEWSCENWGTKWNSQRVEISDESDTYVVIEFDTAWGEPVPIMKKLAKDFPNVQMVHSYEYEGTLGFMEVTYNSQNHAEKMEIVN